MDSEKLNVVKEVYLEELSKGVIPSVSVIKKKVDEAIDEKCLEIILGINSVSEAEISGVLESCKYIHHSENGKLFECQNVLIKELTMEHNISLLLSE